VVTALVAGVAVALEPGAVAAAVTADRVSAALEAVEVPVGVGVEVAVAVAVAAGVSSRVAAAEDAAARRMAHDRPRTTPPASSPATAIVESRITPPRPRRTTMTSDASIPIAGSTGAKGAGTTGGVDGGACRKGGRYWG
jgi:hypothetical protein